MSRLFGDERECLLQVRQLDEGAPYSPFISEPERALLEMLDEVPHRQSRVDAAPFVFTQECFALPAASLDAAEREFLMAVNRCEPAGELLDLPGVDNLPSVRWKVLNLSTLAKTNPKKYPAMVAALEGDFRGWGSGKF